MDHRGQTITTSADIPIVEFVDDAGDPGLDQSMGFIGRATAPEWRSAFAEIADPVDESRSTWRPRAGGRFAVSATVPIPGGAGTADFRGDEAAVDDPTTLVLIDAGNSGTRHSIPWQDIYHLQTISAPTGSPECA